MEYNKLIDHTLLKSDASLAAVVKLCDEAAQHDFMSVCINPCFVPVVKKLLEGTNVKVCTVIGFPLGATLPDVKVFETKRAVELGADEIDMVINVTMAKAHDYEFIANEINMIKVACQGRLLKVILETCLLSNEEIVECCRAAVKAGADYVKTSTGFSSGGATVEHVKLMRDTVGPQIGVKASGGVRTKEDAEKMVAAGASRIGTSSGIKIVAK
ncbi:MAG: deoxyribose-phosphate aldolase [Bacilli bacterium]|jgi:deoxyribose-phosphate aldolase|nr:deoxyribose-phosphate aldolase [Bacilli bacterium]